jgi:hypothetical protein
MTNTTAAPDFLLRPVFQDPDSRLLELARWHEALIRLISAAHHREELAYKNKDGEAEKAAKSDARCHSSDWRAVIEEAAHTMPRTLLGFALKVRIFAEEQDEWWVSHHGDDEASAKARSILLQLMSAAGVSPPSRSTFRLAELAGTAAEAAPEAAATIRPLVEALDPVERLGRRYGAITARLLEIDANLLKSDESADQTDQRAAETAAIGKEITAIETSATYARPSSLAGALFMMMQTWDRVAVMASDLPEDHQHDAEPIRRMMAATIDCLEELSGVPGEALGRRFTGPKSSLG